ncbi:MAG TPA: biotin--[acetyl-CoA-carboxylase] ligase [Bacteroidia bacterium]|jgi:BirA family biotin operon repressor/biotin-[acetyl-CoA-carboxylase] ligase
METLFIGQNAIHLTAVDSTNSYASEMLRQIRPVEGTIIYTFEQNKGRGQRGNEWHSEPNKNVALSIILHPVFMAPSEQFMLTKAVSLALADLMAELLPDEASEVKIKWPNDIYVHGQKIAGILIENIIADNSIQSCIAGIGINVNQTEFNPVIKKAVSLKLLSGKEYDLVSLVEGLCRYVEARYLQLKSRKWEKLDHDYLKYLFQLNEWKTYIVPGEEFEGKILSVSSSGKLQVELHSAEVKEYDLKEIAFV